MARINEEDISVQVESSYTPEELEYQVALEADRARAASASNPNILAQSGVFTKVPTIEEQVAAATPVTNPYAGMSTSDVALEKARESGIFYGSENAGMNEENRKKYPELVGPATTTPYKPPTKNSGNSDTAMSDAYALLIQTFKLYGLEDLVPDIIAMMEQGIGANEAGLKIRELPRYKERFAGNEARRKAGLNVLSEEAYLNLENSYSETLRAYGLGSYFGTDARGRQAKMSEIIGADISAVEFKDRIDTVVTRVQNSDPAIKNTLKSFYNIGDTDLIGYFLNPKENLPKLQEKVTSAEIGTEFLKQGLTTGVTSAEEYAKLGIDKAAAAKGAGTIAGLLPESQFLGQVYKEEGINYTQGTAEEEVMKGLDSARRKRLRLAEKEAASFSGSSGTSRVSLSGNNSGAF